MRKVLLICSLLLTAGLAFGTQERSHSKSVTTKHSNAHAGKPAASKNRDTGKHRAEDTGKGKKKGLKKLAFWQHNKKHQKGKS
jgi:hypothetical protein